MWKAGRRRSAWLVAIAATLAGCSGEGPTVPPNVELLPTQLLFRADAEGIADNGKQASCYIETYIELGRRVDRGARIIQHGIGGGDAVRVIARDEDTNVQFWAHTYFPDLEFHHIAADSVEIHSPISEAATDSRFWHELGNMPGHRRANELGPGELARGTWTCHPMDTPPSSGEYYDAEGSLEGTWVLTAR